MCITYQDEEPEFVSLETKAALLEPWLLPPKSLASRLGAFHCQHHLYLLPDSRRSLPSSGIPVLLSKLDAVDESSRS